jgi:hypothetical protein
MIRRPSFGTVKDDHGECSPMVTAIRAAIMLTVLVGLPAAWVYYGPLPDSAQRVVDRFVATAKEAVGWKESSPTARIGSPASVSFDQEAAAFAAAPSPAASTVQSHMPQPAAAPTLAERVEPLLTKLRELGVAEYALEPWGGEHRLFRFHCEMPLADGGQATEQFEAIAADPQASIEQVVADVAAWQASRGATLAAR